MNMEKFYNRLTGVAIAVGLTIMVTGMMTKCVNANELFDLKKEAINTVVQLHRNCSGVVVDVGDPKDTWINTANHCVSDDATPDPKGTRGVITIDDKDRGKTISTTEYVYDVVARDTSEDIAVIKLRKQGLFLDAAKICKEDPIEGEDAWTVGYPMGLTRTITQGHIGQYESVDTDLTLDPYGDARKLYRATPAITGGNSGGGLFIKRGDHFCLAGTSDLAAPRFPEAGFYVPQDKINELVNRAVKLDKENAEDRAKEIEQKKAND